MCQDREYVIKWKSGGYVIKIAGCSFYTSDIDRATKMTKLSATRLKNKWNHTFGYDIMKIKKML